MTLDYIQMSVTETYEGGRLVSCHSVCVSERRWLFWLRCPSLLLDDSWLEISATTEPVVLLISIDIVLFHFLGLIMCLSRKEIIQIEVICVCHSTRCLFSSLSLILLSVTSWDSSSQVMIVSVLWLSPCLFSEVMLKWNGHCDSWLTRWGFVDALSCSTAAAIFRFKFDRDFSTCNKVYVLYQYAFKYLYYNNNFCTLKHFQ